jgi:hypothetical protein
MDETAKEKKSRMKGNDGGGFIWFLGVIGAAVYYVQSASGFLDGAFGLLKALVWPAIVAYHLLQSFGA